MKTILAIVTLSCFAASAQAQEIKESAVPANIVKNFHESFKDAKVRSWEKEKNGSYEVEYTMNSKESSSLFTSEGALVQTKNKIAISELPKAAADYISKNYPGYKISELEQGIAPTGEFGYEAEIKKGNREIELSFDANGNFLREETEN